MQYKLLQLQNSIEKHIGLHNRRGKKRARRKKRYGIFQVRRGVQIKIKMIREAWYRRAKTQAKVEEVWKGIFQRT